MKYVNKNIENNMITKSTESTTSMIDEIKDQNSKYSLSKFDFDLYHEEDDIANKVIRVQKVPMPNKGKKWKITSDNKLIFIIEGNKISKKEREFLQTIDGFNFILSQAKIGIKSLNSFRNELKKILDKIPEEVIITQPIAEPVKKSKKKSGT
jgi:hypothetical protein